MENGACLEAVVQPGYAKPSWQSQSGTSVRVTSDLKLCWEPACAFTGAIVLSITTSACKNLGADVPKYDIFAMDFDATVSIQGQTPMEEPDGTRSDGYIYSMTEVHKAEGGLYNDDGPVLSPTYCKCDACDPTKWDTLPASTRSRCHCEMDPDTGKPKIDVEAFSQFDFTVVMSDFTPGKGVDIRGSINMVAYANFLGFDFQQNLLEDTTIFDDDDVFEVPSYVKCPNPAAAGGGWPIRRLAESQAPESVRYRCENSCMHANDGHCVDGGPRSRFSLCEFGTDCNDCGTRNVRT